MRRALIGIWLIVGIAYAATTMAAELIWKQAHDLVETAGKEAVNNPNATVIIITALAKGLRGAERAAKLAPELQWIRSSPAMLALENPMMDDTQAIDLLQRELRYDPYDPKLMTFLALRLNHAGRWNEAIKVYQKAELIWPMSPIVGYLNYNLNPYKKG